MRRDGQEVAQQPVGGKIAAKRISEDIPGDPENDVWKQAVEFKIPLMLLWQKPDSLQRVISVRALNNDSEIAFLVEWKDATKNSFLDLDAFRDGAALQFPVHGKAKPAFWMGEGPESKEAVNIWFWKAELQEQINKGTQTTSNTPVENLIAGGFGTLTLIENDSPVFGKGIWKDGKWSVVFKRSFHGTKDSANFVTGNLTPIGFAVWDGGEADVGSRKAVSTWYYVAPERLSYRE
jgi:DMSO reductase family type II enzyme heme b subunit